MTVEPTDKLLVNRDGSSFYINAENMAELRDTDLMLVCRDGYSYKATGKEIKDSTGGGNPVAPTIGDAVLTGPSSFAGGTFETTLTEYNSGNPAAQQSLKAKVVGPYAVVGETSPITDVAGPGSADINIAGTGPFYLSGTGDSSADYSLVASQSWFNADVNDPAKQGAGANDNSGIRITDISETITCTYSNSSPGTAIAIVFGNASVSTGDRTVVASGDIQGGSVSATSDAAKTDIPKGSFGTFLQSGTAGTFTINTTTSYGFIFYIGTDTGLVTLTLTDRTNLDNGLFEVVIM